MNQPDPELLELLRKHYDLPWFMSDQKVDEFTAGLFVRAMIELRLAMSRFWKELWK